MDMSNMPGHEVETLLRLLAEMEREEWELIMQDRHEAEQMGQLH